MEKVEIGLVVGKAICQEIVDTDAREARLARNIHRIMHCLDQIDSDPEVSTDGLVHTNQVRGWLRVLAADADMGREPDNNAQFL